jgi:hypothetical protein
VLKHVWPEKPAPVVVILPDEIVDLSGPGAEEALTAAVKRAVEKAKAARADSALADG